MSDNPEEDLRIAKAWQEKCVEALREFCKDAPGEVRGGFSVLECAHIREYELRPMYDFALKRLSALNERIAELERLLKALGKQRQFRDQLCWCETAAGTYCVGQKLCNEIQAALKEEKPCLSQTPSSSTS